VVTRDLTLVRSNLVREQRNIQARPPSIWCNSEKRQRAAIEGFVKRAGLAIVDWFYDPAVSGADPIEARPGFSALLDRLDDQPPLSGPDGMLV
jgi:DNA invertase Pin-like site-specific DNA recombinase